MISYQRIMLYVANLMRHKLVYNP